MCCSFREFLARVRRLCSTLGIGGIGVFGAEN